MEELQEIDNGRQEDLLGMARAFDVLAYLFKAMYSLLLNSALLLYIIIATPNSNDH